MTWKRYSFVTAGKRTPPSKPARVTELSLPRVAALFRVKRKVPLAFVRLVPVAPVTTKAPDVASAVPLCRTRALTEALAPSVRSPVRASRTFSEDWRMLAKVA